MSALTDFVRELRGLGVRVFKGEFSGKQIEIELGPLVLDEPGPVGSKQEELDTCKCGCKLYEHTNGLCLNGCEPDKCAGPTPS